MTVPRITPFAPRFLTQPRDVVLEAVAAAEPNLDRRAVDRSIAEVAGTRARLRSLAEALDASPDLLNSGRPEGPRVVGLFIDALRQHGAENVVPPRCANCGQVRPLPRTDGPRRLCASCGGSPSKDARLPCAFCGQIRQVAGRDIDGRPRCYRHRPGDQGAAELVCDVLAELETGLSRDALRTIVKQAAPQPFQQRQIAGELRQRPELLTGHGAYGTPRVIALIDALIEHGARAVTAPRCPFCERAVPLKFRRDDARCCRSCYEQPRSTRCSRCGEHRPAAARTPEGEPVCTNCMRRDPMNHGACSRCGRMAHAVHRGDRGDPVCKRCWRPPLATCSTCGEHKPCHFSDTGSPRCPNCTYRLTQPPCSICGVARPVRGRTSSGEPICHPCGVLKQPCSTCGKTRIVASRTDVGPLCRTCYSKHPISFRSCDECGIVERCCWRR